jgi:hypothetical protein
MSRVLMPVPSTPALPQLPRATVGADASHLGTHVAKEDPIEDSDSVDGGAGIDRGPDASSGSFSRVFSSATASIERQSSSKGNSSRVEKDSSPALKAVQQGVQLRSSHLRGLEFFLISANGPKSVLESSSEASPRAKGTVDLSTTPGPDQPASPGEKSSATAASRSSLLPFILASALPVVTPAVIVSGSTSSELQEEVGVAGDQPGLINSSPRKADSAIEQIGTSGAVSGEVKAAPAATLLDYSSGGVDTLAFDLRLFPAGSNTGARPTERPGDLSRPASEPKSSSDFVASDVPSGKLASGAAASLNPLPLSPNSQAVAVNPPRDGNKSAASEIKGDVARSPLGFNNGESVVNLAELKSQVGASASTALPVKQTQTMLNPQVSSSYGVISDVSDQASALSVASPEKENRAGPAVPGPQPLASTGFAAAATDQSGVTSAPKQSSNSPIGPMEEHAASVQPSFRTDLSVRMVGQSGETVNVRVSEKAGEIQIAVRASDSATATEIRHELPAMQAGLERIGWHSETTSAPLHTNAQHGDSSGDSEAGGRNQQNWRNNSDGQARQDRRRTPGQDPWWAHSGQDL